jgi:hypothetical protein
LIALRYEKVVFVGAGTGSFAAFNYGRLVGVDLICLFNPQTFVNKEKRQKYGDLRDLSKVIEVSNSFSREELDLKNHKCDIPVYVTYNLEQKLERVHVHNIKHHNNVILFPWAVPEFPKVSDLDSVVTTTISFLIASKWVGINEPVFKRRRSTPDDCFS